MTEALPTASPQVCFVKKVCGLRLFWSEYKSLVIEKSDTNWVFCQCTDKNLTAFLFKTVAFS